MEALDINMDSDPIFLSIDDTYLSELSAGDKALELEMMNVYIDEVPGEVEKISDLFQQREWDGLGIALHAMKSKLGIIGFRSLYARAETLEERCKSSKQISDQELNQFIIVLKASIDEVNKEIQKREIV